MKSSQLRELWYLFWKQKKHHFIPSATLYSNDPSLLWVNSGVAAIRNYFLGLERPPSKRLVNIQKIVRTNDFINIGLTNRHLSFFEMMGNFALGSYFKKEAILWAWEFLTAPQWLGLKKDRLYITVYEKDAATIKICQEDLKIPVHHLFSKPKKTNFWDLGVGPCGPNLEIFYDLGSEFDPENVGLKLLKIDQENERYLEIWNIVFSEFVNLGNDVFKSLPTKNIDTGAGFERLLMVLQKQKNVFATDLFVPIFSQLEKISQKKFYHQHDLLLESSQQRTNQKMKVIVDHLRAAVFLLADLLTDKVSYDFQNKHGYVVRKFLRRAFYQGNVLGIKKPFLADLITVIVEKMQDTYPNLTVYQKQIKDIIVSEEKKFLKIFNNKKVLNFLTNAGVKKLLTGKVLFQLITALGVPAPFLQTLAQEEKWQLQWKEYQMLLQDHQKLSQKTTKINLDSWKILNFNNKKPTLFWENKTVLENSKVIEIVVNQQSVQEVIDQECWVLLNATLFYASKGGQTADSGKLISLEGEAKILDVFYNQNHQHCHLIKVQGKLKIGDKCQLLLNQNQRNLIANNHSATHLLHATLRKVFGKELKQNGSLNNQNYLRLDFFATNLSLSSSLLQKVEAQVNSLIAERITPEILKIDYQKAKAMKALDFFNFAKNFSGKVRVVKIGNFSLELCGGTHVKNTGLLEKFLITNFSKISDDNYRIYALTTKKAITNFWEKKQTELRYFYQKNQFLIDEILEQNYSEAKKIWITLTSSELNYLEWKKTFHSWQNLIKTTGQKMISKKIQNLVTNYSLSSENFHQIKKQKLIFTPILVNHWVVVDFSALFLNKFLTINKKFNADFFFVFIQNPNEQYKFIFTSPSVKTNGLNWIQFFKDEFGSQFKCGQNSSQIQGIFTVKPQLVLNFLIKTIKNII